jgi:hypothetical protein
MRDLKNLTTIDLSFNNLEGSIESLASIKSLKEIWLSNNRFMGNACSLNNHTLNSL